MSDDGPPRLTSNVVTSAQEVRAQGRQVNSTAGLRNLAPRQQCMAPEMMRMVGSMPQGSSMPRQMQQQQQHQQQPQQQQQGAMRNTQAAPQMVQLHQVQQMPVTGRVITMNSMQGPQQLIPVPMRMVSNGTSMGDGQQAPGSIQLMSQFLPANARIGQNIRFMQHPSDASNGQAMVSQQAAMGAMRTGNTALMVVQGPNGPMVLNTSPMHPGYIPQNLVQVQIAQGIQGMQTMQNVQRASQQQTQQQPQQPQQQPQPPQVQQHGKSVGSRCKKRRPESGSCEMSVGEYLALGMDEKGRADSGSGGAESPDGAGDAPPALDRGDSIDDSSPLPPTDSTKSVEAIFIREALAFRARGGGCGKPIVHYMDGFTIEESDVPFPLTQYDKLTEIVSPDVLDDIMPIIADIDVKPKAETKGSRTAKPSPASKQAIHTAEPENEHKRKLPTRSRRSTTAQNESKTTKPKKEEEEEAEEAHEDHAENRRPGSAAHPPRRRTNELELLLNMDFGPKDCGRRILDTEKRKSVLEKEKRTSSEAGDEHAESKEARSRQKRRSTTTPESPVKSERPRSSTDVSESTRRSSGKHDKDKESKEKDKEKSKKKEKAKEREKEKEETSHSTPTVNARMLPHIEDSPEDRCLYCQVSFKEKERSSTTPQYCSTKCRRAYQSMIASEKNGRKFLESMKRVSGGSEGTISSSSSAQDVRMKPDDDQMMPAASKAKRVEEPVTPSKKVAEPAQSSPNPPCVAPRVLVSPTPAPAALRSMVSSPVNVDYSAAAAVHEPILATPVATSLPNGLPNVIGVDYDVDPKQWTPDVAARWAQAVTGSEACAATFLREDVDGDAMLMMGFDDLRNHLSFTFGPAKKLHLAIEQLKDFREQRFKTP